MSASALDRRHAHEVELAMEARALEKAEEKLIRCACGELQRACKVHATLDGILHELTGSLDHGEAEQSVLFPAVDVSRATRKDRAS